MAYPMLRWLGIAALMIAYPLLAHYTNSSSHSEKLGALVSITPVAALALVLAWKSPLRPFMPVVLALSCVALMSAWSALELHFGLVYWLQDMAMQLILFMTFARTLIGGRQPLCTRFAEMVHPPLTPQHEIYARKVTIAWALFFAAMALASTLLFFLTPLVIWSYFANFMTLPQVALMFVGEYWTRKQALPDVKNTHILDAVRAFRNARPE